MDIYLNGITSSDRKAIVINQEAIDEYTSKTDNICPYSNDGTGRQYIGYMSTNFNQNNNKEKYRVNVIVHELGHAIGLVIIGRVDYFHCSINKGLKGACLMVAGDYSEYTDGEIDGDDIPHTGVIGKIPKLYVADSKLNGSYNGWCSGNIAKHKGDVKNYLDLE